jgi:hypothetical protein
MGIDIKIHIDLTPRQKKVVRAAVVAGAVIAALGLGIAIAAPISSTWSVDGLTLKGADLKGALDGLQSQISSGRFVVTLGIKPYSLGATKYVAVTLTGGGGPNGDGTYNGTQVGGYTGAKAICETAASSASAHMCSSDELLHSAQAGIFIPSGWYSYAARTTYSTLGQIRDCGSWTLSNGQEYGLVWATPLQIDTCDHAQAILCCD